MNVFKTVELVINIGIQTLGDQNFRLQNRKKFMNWKYVLQTTTKLLSMMHLEEL